MHKCSNPWRKTPMALALLLGCGMFAAAATPARAAKSRTPRAAGNTGTITGKVYFHGQKPQLRPIQMGKDSVCTSLHTKPVYPQDGQVNSNGTLPYAFVYVKQSSATLPSKPPDTPVVLTQKGCEYEPHVMGVMVGQPFEVMTLDPTTHNIHILAKINKEWNVTQQPGSPSVVRRFKYAEVMIPIRCNVHPWMKAYLGVMKNPFYAVTGKNGSFTLKGLPPGDYTIEVWTALFGTQEHHVTVRSGETATTDFTFEHH
jgi:hypothetical protein